jgi:uncharacterized membrane protein
MQEDLKRTIMNIILAVIIASFIIIFVTSGENDTNSLSASIGGYTGLLFSIIFIIVINYKNNNYFELFPFVVLLFVIATIIFYMYNYFDRIASGEVSSYYATFSSLSSKLLMVQMLVMLAAIYKTHTNEESKLISNQTLAILGLFGTINYIIVITIGIVLHFYATQG